MTPKQANWLHVFTAGVVGGLIAWLIAATFPGYLKQVDSLPLDVTKYLLGGGIAAMAGVYIVANTDTSHFPKSVTFAALCGLSWSTVIEAASSIAQITSDRPAAASVVQAAVTVEEKLADANVVTPEAIQAAAAATTVAAEKVDTITTPAVRERALDMTKMNIERLGFLKRTAPTPALQNAALEGLRTLEQRPDIAPELRSAAGAAISQ